MGDIMKALIEWLKDFFGLNKKVEKPVVKPVVKKDAPKKAPALTKAKLNKLTKAQLEEEGRVLGIELDKRKKKAELVDTVYKASKEALK
jgi:hypothetical protein